MSVALLEPVRLGCAPRFATPRHPDRETLGWQVAKMAERLGRPLMPWQRLVADVAFEMDESGALVYGEVVILVPRQSGKTILVMAKTLTRLVTMAAERGEQRSTYVAQKRLDARKKFERDFRPLLRRSGAFREVEHARQSPSELGDYGWKLVLNNGSEAFEFGTASWWQIGVPDDSGGHGDTLDDFTIDEARFQETAEVEEGLSPSQITRADAQGWIVWTPGTDGTDGTVNSKYLWRKVLAGRAACESGNHGRVAYFEWSAPDEADDVDAWGDPEVWRACMPALGHTVTEDRIRDQWDKALREGTDKIESFRRSYLGQWPRIPVLTDDEDGWGLPRKEWLACLDVESAPADPVRISLDVAVGHASAAFAAAGGCDAGVAVEVIDYRPGTEWVVERAKGLQERWGGPLYLADKSPASTLVAQLERAGVDVVEVVVEEHADACGLLLKSVRDGTVRHRGEPALMSAVRGAKPRNYDDSWLWSRRNSGADICPLVAVTLAAWATTLDLVPARVGFVDMDDLLADD